MKRRQADKVMRDKVQYWGLEMECQLLFCCNLRSESCVQKENGARWLLVGGGLNWEEAPHRERPGCGVGRGNTMSGPRRSKSGEDRRAPLLSHLQPASSQEGLVYMHYRERDSVGLCAIPGNQSRC